MKNTWEALHKLRFGKYQYILSILIFLNVEVITTLQEGSKDKFKDHCFFRATNMALSPQCPTKKKLWNKKLYIVENFVPKVLLIHLV